MAGAKNALTTADLIIVGLEADSKESATRMLAERMVATGRVTDIEGYLEDVRLREAQMDTGLPGGIGIPHARSAHVTRPTVAIGTSVRGVDFGAHDGPAHLIFLIGAPDGSDDAHLHILAALALTRRPIRRCRLRVTRVPRGAGPQTRTRRFPPVTA